MRGDSLTAASSAVLLAAGTGVAYANGLVQLHYLMLWLLVGAVVVTVVLSGLAEAAAYRLVAGLPYWRALGTALAASTASMAAMGVTLSVVDALGNLTPPGYAAVAGVVLLATELPVVWAMNRGFAQQERLLLTALVANLVLYAITAVCFLRFLQ